MTDKQRHGNVRISKVIAAESELREAIRNEGTPRIQDAWDRCEPWLDAIFTSKGDSR